MPSKAPVTLECPTARAVQEKTASRTSSSTQTTTGTRWCKVCQKRLKTPIATPIPTRHDCAATAPATGLVTRRMDCHHAILSCSQRIEGGVSPLPERRGAQTSESDVLGDLRPHSAADVNCFFPTEPFPFSTAEEELPLPNRVESVDVALTENDLRQASQEPEPETEPEIEPRPHPCILTHTTSFDSTAALTDSPHAPCLSPLAADPSPALDNWKTPASHLNHTLPQNIHEIQDTAKDSETR